MRRTQSVWFMKRSPVVLGWTAKDDDPNAPGTTFNNVKPGLVVRLWRQIRHRCWVLWTWDEEMNTLQNEQYMHQSRLEQICFFPNSAYGSVPGSYSDPLLYNTKTSSPWRWHSNRNNYDTVGHWYIDFDDMMRIKDWKPKNPDDPFEIFPRPPQMNLSFDESVDEHGNRTFKYKYRYEFTDPHANVYPYYPFNQHYRGVPDERDHVEGYGFKQGHLLRASKEEEVVIRRIMEEEDREWNMIKQTEVVQEPWYYPGKIRPRDLLGSVDRAKAKWKEQRKAGKPTDPELDPDYDFVKESEMVYPREESNPRVEWKHMWGKKKQTYQTTFNDGMPLEKNVGVPPAHPLDTPR